MVLAPSCLRSAALKIREQSRRNRELRQNESELETPRQSNEEPRVLLADETKRYERMLRDRNKSAKNLAEAESGARRQGAEL